MHSFCAHNYMIYFKSVLYSDKLGGEDEKDNKK